MDKFIELRGYSNKDGIIESLENSKFEPNKEYAILAIKRGDADYLSTLYNSILHLCADVFPYTTLNKGTYDAKVNQEGISMNKVYILRELGPFLGYLSNCTSWRENYDSIQDYDKDKLLKSLDRLKQLIGK